MAYVSQKLLIVALFCFPIFFVVNCSDIKGEHLELPLATWIPVTSTQEPMQVVVGVPDGEGLFYFSCKKTNRKDGEEGSFSNASGKVGETSSFGTRTTYF